MLPKGINPCVKCGHLGRIEERTNRGYTINFAQVLCGRCMVSTQSSKDNDSLRVAIQKCRNKWNELNPKKES